MFLGTELDVFSCTAGHVTQASHLFQGTTTCNSSSCFHGQLPATSTDSSLVGLAEHDHHQAEDGLFKAPDPVGEGPPAAPFDSMISGGSLVDGSIGGALAVAGIGPIGSVPLLDELLYECENNAVVFPPVLGNEGYLSELSVAATPGEREEGALAVDGNVQKSVGSVRLESMDPRNQSPPTPSFLGFEEAAIGLRAARSDDDVLTLGNGSGPANVTQNVLHPSPMPAMDEIKSKERRQKLLRYRNKSERRNFSRKIRYACRKTLAENQPRVRGRFVKIEDPIKLQK